jgi:hypothetical protein
VEILNENSLIAIPSGPSQEADSRVLAGTYAAAVGGAQSLSLIGE